MWENKWEILEISNIVIEINYVTSGLNFSWIKSIFFNWNIELKCLECGEELKGWKSNWGMGNDF